MKEFDEAFELALGDAGGDRLDKEQLRVFIDRMNQFAVDAGQAGRETTEDYLDMCWTCMNAYD